MEEKKTSTATKVVIGGLSMLVAALGGLAIYQHGKIKKLSGSVGELTRATEILIRQNLNLSYHLGQKSISPTRTTRS